MLKLLIFVQIVDVDVVVNVAIVVVVTTVVAVVVIDSEQFFTLQSFTVIRRGVNVKDNQPSPNILHNNYFFLSTELNVKLFNKRASFLRNVDAGINCRKPDCRMTKLPNDQIVETQIVETQIVEPRLSNDQIVETQIVENPIVEW